MMLDVFKGDAFGFTELIAALTKIPYVPTRLGKLGLFAEDGVSTTSVAIEMQNGVLTLVPTAPRGAPGVVKTVERRNVRNFSPVHLPQRVAVMADEVQNLRAFGKDSEEETAMKLLTQKFTIARRDLDLTHEYQRMGALKGIVLDADGSTIYNYFTEFGVTAQTANIALSVNTTKVLQAMTGVKRQIEDKLGGVMNSGYLVLCSPEFMDAMTGHPAVTETYKAQAGAVLRSDLRGGFDFASDMRFEEYRGTIGGQRFIGANKALVIPLGVPELFKTLYAPAPYMETVNTMGVPFYAKMKELDYNTGAEWQVQSNPLHMNTRPDAIVELTAT